MGIVNFAISNYQTILVTVSAVISGSSVILLAISKVTKNKKDDQAASLLSKAAKYLKKLSLNVE